jgi:hypothetical protein
VLDQALLATARADAFEIVQRDPQLMQAEHELLRNVYRSKYKQKEELILY